MWRKRKKNLVALDPPQVAAASSSGAASDVKNSTARSLERGLTRKCRARGESC